jgi:hypothetical protein
MDTPEDAVGREFCGQPDQTLVALAREERIGRLLVRRPVAFVTVGTGEAQEPAVSERDDGVATENEVLPNSARAVLGYR